jgi:hypothetical protein
MESSARNDRKAIKPFTNQNVPSTRQPLATQLLEGEVLTGFSRHVETRTALPMASGLNSHEHPAKGPNVLYNVETKSHMGRLETIEQPSNPNTSKMLAPASTNDVGVDRTKIDGSCEKGLAEMEGGAVPATNDDGSSTNMATTPSNQMEAAAAAGVAARDVGSSTPRLKAGDSVSIESTHFDAPGRAPGVLLCQRAGAGVRRRRAGPHESQRVL